MRLNRSSDREPNSDTSDRNAKPTGIKLGDNVRNSLGELLANINVENDYLVSRAFGGMSLGPNPTMDFPRIKDGGTGLRPQSWFFAAPTSGTAPIGEALISYGPSDLDRDYVDLRGHGSANYTNLISHFFPVEPGVEYEFIIVASTPSSCDLRIGLSISGLTGLPTYSALYFGFIPPSFFQDAAISDDTGSHEFLDTQTLTSSFVAYAFSHTMGAGSRWCSLYFQVPAGDRAHLDQVWIIRRS